MNENNNKFSDLVMVKLNKTNELIKKYKHEIILLESKIDILEDECIDIENLYNEICELENKK